MWPGDYSSEMTEQHLEECVELLLTNVTKLYVMLCFRYTQFSSNKPVFDEFAYSPM